MNLLKLFKRTKKEDNNNARALRYPHRLFSGAVIPKIFIAESLRNKKTKRIPSPFPTKIRINRRYFARQMSDGDFIVCRKGKMIPAVGTFFPSHSRYYTASVKVLAS